MRVCASAASAIEVDVIECDDDGDYPTIRAAWGVSGLTVTPGNREALARELHALANAHDDRWQWPRVLGPDEYRFCRRASDALTALALRVRKSTEAAG